jgi:hypothetical protein
MLRVAHECPQLANVGTMRAGVTKYGARMFLGCPTFRGVPIKRRFCACWGRVVQFDAKAAWIPISG